MPRRKSAKERAKISQSMKEFWRTQPKGVKGDVEASADSKKKLAIGVVTTAAVVGGGALALKKGKVGSKLAAKRDDLLRKLDQKIEEEAFKGVFGKAAGLPEKPNKNALDRFLDARLEAGVRGAKRGAKEGAKQRVATEGKKFVEKVDSKATEVSDYVLNTPKRTAEAFHEGYKMGTTNKNSFGRRAARLYKKAQKKSDQDSKKRKERFGFSVVKESSSFDSYLPRDSFWIEFERKKSAPRKKLSAKHRAAISQGLQEYYDSIPQKQETKADQTEKISRSVLRVARGAKTAAEAGTLGYGLYKAITAKAPKQTLADKLMGGVDAINTVSNSLGNLGRNVSSLTNAADAIHDITSGSKQKQLELKKQALEVKRQANKTNRQVHSVRAKLESKRAKQRDAQMALDAVTGKAYKRLVDTTAATKPGETAAALQRAATGAKKESIGPNKNNDWWML